MAIWETEDFAALRQINKKLVHKDFLKEWNFRLDIKGAPKDFDFYIKDITYGVLDVATDEDRVGAAVYVWPTGNNPLRCSFSARDDRDGRIQLFFLKWIQFAFPNDGTVNLPFGANGSGGYLKKITLYEISTGGNEVAQWSRLMYPTNVGEVSRSRENGKFFETPITLTEFSSIR